MSNPPSGPERPIARDHTHAVHNSKRVLTIEELALAQPGLDRLMAELGPRVHRLAYAGWAGNWPLARYFYRSVAKQLRLAAAMRPRYASAIAEFLAGPGAHLQEAISAGDPAGFDRSYTVFVDEANRYHVEFGKPFLVWVTPPEPPADLDLTAGMAATDGPRPTQPA